MPAISGLSSQLTPLLADVRDEDEWKVLLPIVQDLIEMCLSVQRAHIRDLGARPLMVN